MIGRKICLPYKPYQSQNSFFYWNILRASLVAQTVKNLPTMRETWVWSLGWEDPLENKMAIHSSTIAWKIPRTEERGRLKSMELQRVGHDWVTSLHKQQQMKELWGKEVTCPRSKQIGGRAESYPSYLNSASALSEVELCSSPWLNIIKTFFPCLKIYFILTPCNFYDLPFYLHYLFSVCDLSVHELI